MRVEVGETKMNAILNDKSTEFLANLLTAVDDFDGNLFPPPWEYSAENDTIVGNCPEVLKKFMSYGRFCEREEKSLRLESQFSVQDDEATDRAVFDWHCKREACFFMFWSNLRQCFLAELHARPGMQLGIRKDWKVVFSAPAPPQISIMGMKFPFPSGEE
jgi:hypothetical protein